ncbi:transporter [Thauera sp. Sel9]|uniref:transporter n=1 Tax=Thauera sp. Sel9 TaxID=2974299 RepID=UPI0021E10220|nr:transporter [Thauera sp. Sel9]MCV2217288.1 transporter [Thauera sp. Sel9]
MNEERQQRPSIGRLLGLACVAGAAGMLAAADSEAATGRSFIAPHEYALPSNVPDGFDVFLVYGYLERGDQAFDAKGDKRRSDRTETMVSLLKYSRGWTLESNPNFGYAWELIVPVIGARNRTARTSSSGVGDPIVAPYIWYKLSDEVTVGTDFLFQLPVGDGDVGGGDSWKFTNSVFIDVQLGKFNYTGDVIWNFPGTSNKEDAKAGKSWSTEHLFGYRVSPLVEPYVGVAYEYQKTSAINPANSETDVLGGVMFHFDKASASVHLLHTVDGKNRPAGNSLNFRLVWSL